LGGAILAGRRMRRILDSYGLGLLKARQAVRRGPLIRGRYIKTALNMPRAKAKLSMMREAVRICNAEKRNGTQRCPERAKPSAGRKERDKTGAKEGERRNYEEGGGR